jgi:hypothetical protein
MKLYAKYLFLFFLIFNFNSIISMQILSRQLKCLPVKQLANFKRFISSRPLNRVNGNRFVLNTKKILTPAIPIPTIPKNTKELTDRQFYLIDSISDDLLRNKKQSNVADKESEISLALKYLNPDLNLNYQTYLEHKIYYINFLLKYPEEISSNLGKYLLFDAVIFSDTEMVLLLLKLGIDINQTICIIENEEVHIMDFAKKNVRSLVLLHEKYYLKFY